MAKSFSMIDSEVNKHLLQKDIRDRTKECFVPRCWPLLDDDDGGQLYLSREMVEGGKGQFVQIRRYLFWLVYEYIPDRRKLVMLCNNHRCVNPAHATYKRFSMTPQKIARNIDKGWLSVKDAKKWYNFELGDENGDINE
jgi:hypothetical protein